MSKDKRDAKKRYRDFVDRAIGLELENPLKNVYAGMILGRTRFIKEALSELKKEDLQKEEISQRRALKARCGPEEIIDSICGYFNVSPDEIFENKKKEYRNIAIYLIKKYTDLANKQMGQLFGNVSVSAVAKVYQRFSKRLEGDMALKKKVGGIMSYVKG